MLVIFPHLYRPATLRYDPFADLLPVTPAGEFPFAMGVGLLVRGFRARRIGTVNAGLLVVFALILLRFFDEDLGFAVRGVVFVLLGLAFLAVNLVLARRKGAAS